MLANLALIAAPVLGTAFSTYSDHATPRPRVETVVEATPTRFFAQNRSPQPQLFLFGTLDGRYVETRLVQPGGSLEMRFPSVFPSPLVFEVLAHGEGSLHSSGPIALDAYRSRGFVAVWARVEGTRTSTWLTDPRALGQMSIPSLLTPRASALVGPRNDAALMPLLTPARMPMITPNDGPEGDSPPVLEDDLLPPV